VGTGDLRCSLHLWCAPCAPDCAGNVWKLHSRRRAHKQYQELSVGEPL